ncbi:hypothetical protein PPERSA_02538 [Pseudocohnilembus persalinus]|uniref:Actin-related protein n=1 Tax=Pseudocohnilembus persalinus TaxID=266149 RepID=A0A0V0R595_PSEPJ|nr:hypothetical protein PPERSA_02538 [Pseudocohnilembus persalinus]|eukprot:KRX09666.1 hypothetical protein PPERSA_02538 [Pseudocohnilembus persalinus]
MEKKTVVIDNGTGFTKMGWAFNPEPTYDIPTVISDRQNKGNVQVSKKEHSELDFFIGKEAYTKNNDMNYQLFKPMSSGIVEDWDLMEKFWHRSIFDYLRCEPEDTTFILTEPPLNPPENRENMAEIFFETFNAEGLFIGVQAVMALYSSYYFQKMQNQQVDAQLTGTVLDSGDGVTHIIPISDGYVIGSCIKHIPLAGRDITKFISQMLKDRGETKKFPIQDLERVAVQIKEKYGYVSEGDLAAEFAKFDKKKEKKDGTIELSKKYKKLDFTGHDNKQYSLDVGYERFLGPEMFFHPEFLDSKYRLSIVDLLDNAIQGSPIDTRRNLYGNIVLSGGSTIFDNLGERLEKELNNKINGRIEAYKLQSGINVKPIEIKVTANPFQRYAVWQGGSYLAANDNFRYHTRQQYQEYGSAIARINPVVQPGM